MAISPLITNNFIDSCGFDPEDAEEAAAANRLHQLSDEGQLLLQIAHSTQKEIEHPNTPDWVKQQAGGLIYTLPTNLTEGERAVARDIHAVLTGNANPEKHAQDAQHVFEAQKYGSYFVTTDKRILDKADALRRRCGVEILRPSEFLKLVEHALAEENDA